MWHLINFVIKTSLNYFFQINDSLVFIVISAKKDQWPKKKYISTSIESFVLRRLSWPFELWSKANEFEWKPLDAIVLWR